MKHYSVFFLLVLMLSCNQKGIHSKSLMLAPTENIQMLFERHEALYGTDAGNWRKHFSEIKGNVLVLKKRKSAINYVKVHRSEILLEKDLRFLFDTASGRSNLYVIDQNKAFQLLPTQIVEQKLKTSSEIQILLSEEIKAQMPWFFAQNLEKEIVAFDRNGFVAGASELSKTEEGDLMIKKENLIP